MRSKLEEKYADMLEKQKQTGEIVSWEYEPMRITIGVNRYYTPDFRVVYPDRTEIVEAKGFPFIWNPKTKRREFAAEKEARRRGKLAFMVAAYWVLEDVIWRLVEENKKTKEIETIYCIKDGKKLKRKDWP